jgi:hypothetical protein
VPPVIRFRKVETRLDRFKNLFDFDKTPHIPLRSRLRLALRGVWYRVVDVFLDRYLARSRQREHYRLLAIAEASRQEIQTYYSKNANSAFDAAFED